MVVPELREAPDGGFPEAGERDGQVSLLSWPMTFLNTVLGWLRLLGCKIAGRLTVFAAQLAVLPAWFRYWFQRVLLAAEWQRERSAGGACGREPEIRQPELREQA